LVIPIYVASLGKTQSGRDSYIKLDREKALKLFDDREDEPDIHKRLQEVKNTLAAIFDRPGVNIEPDSIPEKVPKIVEMWYDRFVLHKPLTVTQESIKNIKGLFNDWILHPSQSFRLIVIGIIMGFAVILSLTLLFMPSKSRKHTDIKKGVAIGNILALLVIIIVCTTYYYRNDEYAQGMYCTQCEAMVCLEGAEGEAVNNLFESIPDIDEILTTDCGCDKYGPISAGHWLDVDCLYCTCSILYDKCNVAAALAELLQVSIIIAVLLVVLTAIFVHRFVKVEAYSLSF